MEAMVFSIVCGSAVALLWLAGVLEGVFEAGRDLDPSATEGAFVACRGCEEGVDGSFAEADFGV